MAGSTHAKTLAAPSMGCDLICPIQKCHCAFIVSSIITSVLFWAAKMPTTVDIDKIDLLNRTSSNDRMLPNGGHGKRNDNINQSIHGSPLSSRFNQSNINDQTQKTRKRGVVVRIPAPHGNIGHDFHELLQHLFYYTTTGKFQAWLLDSESRIDQGSWYGGFLLVLARYLHVELFYKISDATKNFSLLNLTHARHRKVAHLESLLQTISSACQAHFAIDRKEGTRLTRLLYNRADTYRRQLLNWESIACNFDIVSHSLNLSFEEQYRLVSKTGFWLAPEGGHFTNVIFMPSQAVVIDIEAGVSNSWQLKFGTSRAIRHFLTVNATKRKFNPRSTYNWSHYFDDHIVVDSSLARSIAEKAINYSVMEDFKQLC